MSCRQKYRGVRGNTCSAGGPQCRAASVRPWPRCAVVRMPWTEEVKGV